MRRYRASILLLALAVLLPLPLLGQNNGEAAKKTPPEEIQLSFSNADINVIVKWLAETTGKAIIKHKQVNVKINVLSSKKIPRAEAIRLVYRALALEGFSAIENRDVIMIVPEAMEAKVSPELVNGGDVTGVMGGKQMMIKFFDLEHARAVDLKEKLKAVLSDKSKLEVDDRANKIIVTDYAENVHFLEELIRELDVPRASDSIVRVFPLRHTEAEDLAKLIGAVFGAQSGSGAPTGAPVPAVAGSTSSSGVTIMPDKTSNRLVVLAAKEKMTEVESLIETLDTEKPADVAVRTIQLANVDSEELVRELRRMYQRLSGSSLKEVIEIASNYRSNSLIVLSSQANFEAIQTLVESLDTEDAQQRAMEVFPLKYADAEDMAEKLEELHDANSSRNRYGGFFFFGGSSRQNRGEVRFVAVRRRNEVIAIGAPGDLERLKPMVEMLDQPAGDDNLAPRIYPLKFVSSADITEVLNELFVKKMDDRPYWYDDGDNSDEVGRLFGKVRIADEPTSNSIIVTTNSLENFSVIEKVLQQLDVRNEENEATLTMQLRFASAMNIANNLNILFAQPGAPQRRPRQQQNRPQQQRSNQNMLASNQSFELEDEQEEEGFFPWLGGQPQQRNRDGRVERPVSDLVGKVRVVPDTRTNALMVTTSPHFFPQVLSIVNDLDVPTPQVLIEATILQITRDDRERLGVRWSPNGGIVFEEDDLDDSLLGTGAVTYTETFVGSTLANSTRTGILDGMVNLDLLIQFLEKNTEARVRAEPRINIADNERGKLFVGSRIPFISNSLRTTEGGENVSFEYVDVGVILEVTPHINSEGVVTLGIRVEASQVREGETLFGGAIIDTRNYKTEVTVDDGRTIVLGGLIQSEESSVTRKFPILGDIPFLGRLFRKDDTVVRDVELIVFLKPSVTRDREEVQRQLQQQLEKTPGVLEWEESRRQEQLENED